MSTIIQHQETRDTPAEYAYSRSGICRLCNQLYDRDDNAGWSANTCGDHAQCLGEMCSESQDPLCEGPYCARCELAFCMEVLREANMQPCPITAEHFAEVNEAWRWVCVARGIVAMRAKGESK